MKTPNATRKANMVKNFSLNPSDTMPFAESTYMKDENTIMKLTPTEKLILSMLADIKLGTNDIDPAFVKEAIFQDNTWALDWKYPDFDDSLVNNPVEVTDVVDIMATWSILEDSYNRLDAGERAVIGRLPLFGFDGNNESKHLNVANFLIDYLDRFSTFKGRVENTHCPRLHSYKVMVKTYKSNNMSDPLDSTQIQRLLKVL